MMQTSLFESANLRLTAVDPEQDAKIEATWTYDLDYSQELIEMPARPLGAIELKKLHEDKLKRTQERGNQYTFAIHLKNGDQLAGFIRFPFIFWMHATALLRLAVADPSILARFGREALDIALTYGFRELNLYRVETVIPAYRQEMINLLESSGFLLEVRRRQVFYREGKYHDALTFGLLHEEWKNQPAMEVEA